MNFIQALLNFSEKAANIARTIRHDPCLFTLLVEEKGQLEKNARFLHDFKTLADVLIQESLRHFMSFKFPSLSSERIQGEESSTFTNVLGEKIVVRICDSQIETANLLAKVLDGNTEAANILSEVIHDDDVDVEVDEELKLKVPQIPLKEIGIWIDPIDSTAEYINGKNGNCHTSSCVYHDGLQCVTVLIGVYDLNTGLAVAGIINRPFAMKDANTSRWISKIYYGISYNDMCTHSLMPRNQQNADHKAVIVISVSENLTIQEELSKHFSIINATGAGYKSLTVALGLADAYFCSKGSTFRWDTCAPHGILRSLGGGIISYKSFIELGKCQQLSESSLLEHQITYNKCNDTEITLPSEMWCNKDGLIAYRNPAILNKIYESIKNLINAEQTSGKSE